MKRHIILNENDLMRISWCGVRSNRESAENWVTNPRESNCSRCKQFYKCPTCGGSGIICRDDYQLRACPDCQP